MTAAGVRVALRIHGRVQGVGYRYAALRQAGRLGLRGYVCNREDGSVEAVAEGDEQSVAAFVAWCREGPPGSQVTRIDETRSAPTGEFRSFSIA